VTAALSLERVCASYDRLQVLFDVEMSVPRGSVVALLGPNGAGKTSTLRTAAGVVKPSAGRILLQGQDVTSRHAYFRSRLGLCLIPEGRGIFPTLSVRENLMMHRHLRRGVGGEAEERAYDWFPVLAERRHQIAGTLSGGEQQMLALSRALTTEPSVLMVDEISMGLAPMIVESMFEVIRRLRDEGLSMLIVEQNVEAALDLADYVILMNKGAVIAVGQPADLDDRLDTAYFGGNGTSNGASKTPHGAEFVRTRRGSLRHRPTCIIPRTAVDDVLVTNGSEFPACKLCGESEVPSTREAEAS
jgi:branched-chain amino acid transport system ATP-binding protein